jgi:NAD(P)-dependent dehydrogenase (short-subunit alcohol dehydrogenase family)
MDLGLQDKVALVFGGSQGIGRAAAERFLAEGAKVAVTGRSLESFAVQGDFGDGAMLTLAADLTVAGSAEAAVSAVIAEHGRLDVLVVSAGAAQGGLFWELDDAVWEEALALKFLGLVRALRAASVVMKDQGSGAMVAVVGNGGKQPNKRMLPGGAANAACLAVVRGLAEELAPYGVRVNAVNPGPTRTARWDRLISGLAAGSGEDAAEVEKQQTAGIPLGRINEPEEVAQMIAFLASDAAGTITGTSLTADGGMTAAIA